MTSCHRVDPEEMRRLKEYLTQSYADEVACALADSVGARIPGSEGDRRAVEWGLAKMQQIGLSNVRAEKVMVTHWERIAETAAIVEPVRQPLFVTALGHSVSGTVTAEVLRVTSIEELNKLPDERVRGKIVYYDKSMQRGPRAWSSYGATVDVRSLGAAAAAKKGAVASLIRSIGTGNQRAPHTGAQRTRDGIPPIPAAALSIPDAALLTRLIAKFERVRVSVSIETKMHGEAESYNVIGELTGRELPDEIVLLGAHLDSWDLGTGAIDDAAGVGVVLEVVRLLKSHQPRRTIRVVLFANEEHGLKGAYAYAKEHEAEMPKHQAALEIDGGTGRALDFLWWGAESSAPAMQRISDALSRLEVTKAARTPDAGGADLIPLTDLGVTKLDLLQDGTYYFDVHHTADDTCDKIVPSDLRQLTAAAAIAAWSIAEEPALLERAPKPPER